MDLHKRLTSNDPEWLAQLEERLNQLAEAQLSNTPAVSPAKRKDANFHIRLDELGLLEDAPQIHSAPPETDYGSIGGTFKLLRLID